MSKNQILDQKIADASVDSFPVAELHITLYKSGRVEVISPRGETANKVLSLGLLSMAVAIITSGISIQATKKSNLITQ